MTCCSVLEFLVDRERFGAVLSIINTLHVLKKKDPTIPSEEKKRLHLLEKKKTTISSRKKNDYIFWKTKRLHLLGKKKQLHFLGKKKKNLSLPTKPQRTLHPTHHEFSLGDNASSGAT